MHLPILDSTTVLQYYRLQYCYYHYSCMYASGMYASTGKCISPLYCMYAGRWGGGCGWPVVVWRVWLVAMPSKLYTTDAYDNGTVTDRHGNNYNGRRFWSQAHLDLVDIPVMMPILREILGDRSYCHAAPNMPDDLGTQFRLDHDNGARRQLSAPCHCRP